MILPLLLAACLSTDPDPCFSWWYVKIEYLERTSDYDQPAQLVVKMAFAGPLTMNRQEALERRDAILKDGYQMPNAGPGPEEEVSERRLAPGSFLTVSVRRICCNNLPIPNGECWEVDP